MKFYKFPKWTVIGVALLVVTPVIGSGANRLGGYDFTYEVKGDSRVKPIQVFDNGQVTYFQFRSGEPVPAIFAETNAGPVLSMPAFEGPYIKVQVVAGGYSLKLGSGYARVTYQGGGRVNYAPPETDRPNVNTMSRLDEAAKAINATYQVRSATPAPIHENPALERDSYATPIKGDRVEWTAGAKLSREYPVMFPAGTVKMQSDAVKAFVRMLPEDLANSYFEIQGRDDHTFKEELPSKRASAVADLLVSRGVPRENIRMKVGNPLPSEENAKHVTGASIRWLTQAPAPSRPEEDPIAELLARYKQGRISRADLVKELSAARPQVPSRSSGLTAVQAQTTWQVLKSDETMERLLRRWGHSSGWNVDWRNAPEIRITADSVVSKPDFITAADLVITQAKAVGYRLKAAAYKNNVLVITEEPVK